MHCLRFEDVLTKLNSAKCFSILDARSAYWNIRLDQESSLYIYNLLFGRYRFLRLPFGLICPQNVFQKTINETFGDLAGATAIADDVVVYGYKSDFSDHDENLCAVLQRAQETDLHFNLGKDKFRCTRNGHFPELLYSQPGKPSS